MTKEEAIIRLKRGEPFSEIYDPVWDEALNMAISALSENREEPTYYPPCIDCNKKMDEIRRTYDKLKEIPSVENKGEWIPQPSNKEQGERDFVWWKCSKCGQVIYSETEKDREEFHAFCGRCGADMRDNIVSEKEKRNRDIIINMVKDM